MARRSESPGTLGTGLEPPRSNTAGDAPDNELQLDLTGVPAAVTGSQKRGRGRPPKAKSDSQPNVAVSAQPTRKPRGRPKRSGATVAAVPTASAAAVVKSARGRSRRSNTATESLVTAVNGSRKRGRPKKDDVAAATVPATATTTAAAPAKKRGRKPKSEQVAKRTVGRPRKATEATTGQGAADPREFKKKAALLKKKVKQAAEKLKIAVSAIEDVQQIAAGMQNL